MAIQQDRRNFLQQAGGLFASMGLGTLGFGASEAAAQTPITVSDVANDNIIHLPRSYEGIRAISDEQTKVMLAAVTASGGESIAYYTPDAQGFSLERQVELYPDHTSSFAKNINFKSGTYATPEMVQQIESGENPEYHIPVLTADKQHIKGILVIKPPLDDLGRVQNAAEAQDAKDMHERSRIRQAKLNMAQYIVDQHADLFGKFTKQDFNKHHTIEAKKAYFIGLIKAMFETFPLEKGVDVDTHQAVQQAKTVDQLHDALREISLKDTGSQASHVLGVSEFMNLGMQAVNEAAAEQGRPQVITEDQRELGILMTILHDVGKTQFASTFMGGYPDGITQGQKDKFTEYFTNHNHDHPVLSMVTMLTYPAEAVTAASHHHGLFRHTPQDLYDNMKALAHDPAQAALDMLRNIGDSLAEKQKAVFNHFSVLSADGNIRPDELPPLSRMMRVADVAEAISGRASIPLPYALVELEKKVVATRNKDKPSREKNGQAAIPPSELEWKAGDTYEITPDTIDPDYLCFMIAHGVFEKYGQVRDEELGGAGAWKSTKNRGHEGEWNSAAGDNMHQAELSKAIGEEILKRYHWEERKEEIEQKIVSDIAACEFIKVNSPLQQRALKSGIIH